MLDAATVQRKHREALDTARQTLAKAQRRLERARHWEPGSREEATATAWLSQSHREVARLETLCASFLSA